MSRTWVKRYQKNEATIQFLIFVFLQLCLIGLTIGLMDGDPVQTGNLSAVGSVTSNDLECTGTLIQGDLVLTAGHCVCDDLCDTSSCHKNATFILHDVKIKNESKIYKNYPFTGKVWVNPNYGSKFNCIDLALIKLDKNASQIANVETLHVENSQDALLGRNISIIGFKNGPCCEVEENKLKLQYHPQPHNVIGNLINISVYENFNKGICPGDSGAPVLNIYKNVIGVTTGGPKEKYIETYCKNPTKEIEFRSITLNKEIYEWIYNYSRSVPYS
jgi:V8-like Glu-specific endopeptidase